jgi:CheY-like chemotaxis protein
MSSPQKAPHTILVVDDDASIREIERRYLGPAGYDIFQASSALEAIGLIGAGLQVDLLIADLRMPEIGGEEMVSRIRATHPDLKVLFVTGTIEGLLEARTLNADTEGFVRKPFTRSELVDAVSALLVERLASGVGAAG